jgi:membrane associated rhomboid family serine protease
MNQQKKPWESSELLPERPADIQYGYLQKGKPVACTQDELVEMSRIREDHLGKTTIDWVWTPDVAHLRPISEVTILQVPYIERKIKEMRARMLINFIYLFLPLTWLLLSEPYSGRMVQVALIFVVFLFLLPNISLARKLFQISKTPDKYLAQASAELRFGFWLTQRSRGVIFPYLMTIVFFPTIISFFVGIDTSASVAGLIPSLTYQGQFWRLITYSTLHAGLYHFLFNVGAFSTLSMLLERLTHRYVMPILYITSVVSGGVFSLFLRTTDHPSIGSSCGIMGLLGCLVVIAYHHRKWLPAHLVRTVFIGCALIFASGVMAFEVIDNAGHIGGFVMGVILGRVLFSNMHLLDIRPSCLIRISYYVAVVFIIITTVLTLLLLLGVYVMQG